LKVEFATVGKQSLRIWQVYSMIY